MPLNAPALRRTQRDNAIALAASMHDDEGHSSNRKQDAHPAKGRRRNLPSTVNAVRKSSDKTLTRVKTPVLEQTLKNMTRDALVPSNFGKTKRVKTSESVPPLKRITFEVHDPDWIDDGNGPSPYVPLARLANMRALDHMQQRDEVVIRTPCSLTLSITYPLSTEYVAYIVPKKGVVTRGQLALSIAKAYQHIFDDEKTTSSVDAMQTDNPECLLATRASTGKKWGVYNYSLDDLLMHTVHYNIRDNSIEVSVDP